MRRPTAITQLDLPMRVADLSFFVMFSGAIRQGLAAELGATCFTVLVVLKSHARPSDGRVYLSVSQLASLTGLAPNTVRAALKKLEQKQLVQVVEEGKTATRRYFIIDQFAWKKLGSGSVTDALESLEDGLSDGTSSVRYVPRSSTMDRQQLQAWLEANQAPTSPNVSVVHQEVQRQVVQQQVVQQQVVQQQVVQHFHIHPPGTDDATAEAAVEFTAPFLRESRILKAQLTQGVTEPSSTAEEGLLKP